MLDCIVDNTNDYARAHDAGETGRSWKNIVRNDLVLWIAIVIYQGIHKEPAVADYWSNDPTTPEHRIAKHMGLSRFEQIKRYLHVSPIDVSSEQYFDKVEPLMSHIRDTSKKLYIPKSNVSVDEMMVKFSRRSAHTFRMKRKPIHAGYKIISLCDDGYTYTFLPTSRIHKSDVELAGRVNDTGCLVAHLVKQLSYQHLAFNIYMDNYFTSFALFQYLRDHGVGACGTVRKPIVASVIKVSLNSNFDWDTRSGAVKDEVVGDEEWQVSTVRRKPRETSTNGPKVRRVFGNSENKKLKIPKIINDYNRNMNGVDMADQRRSYYCTHQPSRRNWMPLFFWLLDTAIINSYLLAKKKGSTLLAKDFRHKLAWEMIRSTQPKNNLRSYEEEFPGPPVKKTKVTKTFVLDDERFLGSNHLPEKNAQFTTCR